MAVLSRFRRENPSRHAADRLNAAIAVRAREPVFYAAFGVPDTVDGRFDLIALHAFIVMDALKNQGTAGEDVSAQLATVLFAGFEDALRDLGVGDFGLSRRIKAMASAFYGRLEAYGAAREEHGMTEAEEHGMTEAIVRNVYRGDAAQTAHAAVLSRYILRARAELRHDEVLTGDVDFGPLPE